MKSFRLFFLLALNILLIGSARADDSGSLFWMRVTESSQIGNTLCIVQKPTGELFAAGQEKWLYRSDDNGKTWSQIKFDSTMSNLHVYSVAIGNSGDIIIGTSGGVFYSDNNCISWNYIGKGLGDPIASMVAVKPGGDIFVATAYSGLFRSTNKGTNWKEINNGLGTPSINTITFTENNDLFLGTYSGVFYSRDNGTSWKQSNSGIPSSLHIYSFGLLKKFHLLAGTSGGAIYKTTNNGGTWFPIMDLKDSSRIYSIVVKNEAEIYASVYGKGVYYTNDSGATWSWMNDGLYNKDILCMILANNTSDIFAGTWGSGIFLGTSDVIQTTFAGGEFCAGSEIDIQFTKSIDFDSTNYFTAQLSDENGSFANPVNIGKLKGKDAGTIRAKLPKFAKSGTGYRVRVVSYKPTATGKSNGVDFTIKELPPLSIDGKFVVCPNVPLVYKTETNSDIETRWAAIGGKISGDVTSGSVTVTWDDVGKGSVKLVQRHLITGCIDSVIQEIQIRFPAKPTIKRDGMTLVSSYDSGNQWYLESEKIPGATEKIITPEKTGKYSVEVTDSNGCKTQISDQYYINVESVIDIEMNKFVFELSPLPASDYLKIRLLKENSLISYIAVYNLIGEKLFISTEQANFTGINVNGLSSGVYLLNLVVDNQIYIERFVVQR